MADYYVRSGQTNEAVAAYEEAKERAGDAFPLWELEYQMSLRFLEAGNRVLALEFVERALESAPPENRDSVEQLRQAVLADE